MSLDTPTAVSERIKDLGDEIADLDRRRATLVARLARVDKDLPLPESSSLVASEPPPMPAGLDATDLQNRPSKHERGRRLTTAQCDTLAAYKTLVAERQAAIDEHARDVAAVQQRREARRFELGLELSDLGTRQELAKLRLGYLEAWDALAKKMAMPARAALVSFVQPRIAVRAEAEAFEKVADAASALGERLGRLQNLVAAGSLLGFRAQHVSPSAATMER